jgi:hypothetical protein
MNHSAWSLCMAGDCPITSIILTTSGAFPIYWSDGLMHIKYRFEPFKDNMIDEPRSVIARGYLND